MKINSVDNNVNFGKITWIQPKYSDTNKALMSLKAHDFDGSVRGRLNQFREQISAIKKMDEDVFMYCTSDRNAFTVNAQNKEGKKLATAVITYNEYDPNQPASKRVENLMQNIRASLGRIENEKRAQENMSKPSTAEFANNILSE